MKKGQSGSRVAGGTESNWCKAARGGTGIAVLALLITKPFDVNRLQQGLNKLQNSHPILKTRLVYSNSETEGGGTGKGTGLSFLTSPTPYVKIESYSLSATSKIIGGEGNDTVSSPLQKILEHELNQNTWRDLNTTARGSDMFLASMYAVSEMTWVAAMRLHVAACDRTTAVSLLKELLLVMTEAEGEKEEESKNGDPGGGLALAIEDLVPCGMAKKAIWTHGIDVLSYSVNSIRQTNLKFHDTRGKRFSQIVRLQLNQPDTNRVLAGCKRNRIKLCGALTAAGLIAAHSSKNSSRTYGVITFTDCRSSLDPPLSFHDFGFYNSAIINNHVMKGGESLWELAKKTYGAFATSKNNKKHFTDMADTNFLMCKAIDNPSLTSSSALRTSIMSVFEDAVVDDSTEMQRHVGVEDYMGCASVHGVGPSMGIFDTIRDGGLDCVCVYPAPLHSREQMQDLVNNMKAILIEAGKTCQP
ncbi:uncharacterized protein LOC107494016 [Arachis duranensis]|uniref:Uncharacterized protein LOC107494016 n=1 Tax=Arachis duranensis TaxID=130453 RepID=A0A6P4DM55_ARADU|nr:uncharacterized protein LOC107494016 [Arachis duranensis]